MVFVRLIITPLPYLRASAAAAEWWFRLVQCLSCCLRSRFAAKWTNVIYQMNPEEWINSPTNFSISIEVQIKCFLLELHSSFFSCFFCNQSLSMLQRYRCCSDSKGKSQRIIRFYFLRSPLALLRGFHKEWSLFQYRFVLTNQQGISHKSWIYALSDLKMRIIL